MPMGIPCFAAAYRGHVRKGTASSVRCSGLRIACRARLQRLGLKWDPPCPAMTPAPLLEVVDGSGCAWPERPQPLRRSATRVYRRPPLDPVVGANLTWQRGSALINPTAVFHMPEIEWATASGWWVILKFGRLDGHGKGSACVPY
jgi:hypothetical protein